jgi:hypothetical protein
MGNDIESVEEKKMAMPARSSENFEWGRLAIVFGLLIIALGAVQALDMDVRHGGKFMDPDGIVYLDIGEAYFRGDWNTAINGLWPPLYSWLLGLVMFVLNPSPRLEFSVVRLVNFIIYLFAFGCFHFFLFEVIRYQRHRITRFFEKGYVTLPEWAWAALGYSLFVLSSLKLITIKEDSPDMFVAAIIYLASGIILRISRGFTNWGIFVLLGGLLGVGYLTKAFMFYLAFIFLAVSVFSVGNLRRAVPRLLIAVGVFFSVGSLYFVPLSVSNGRLTFGDSGGLNYLYHINRIPYVHWQGEPPGNGTPEHPTRKIYDLPAIYEFKTPIGGTYPPWHDPVYWNEGAVPHFDLRGHIRVLINSCKIYFEVFFLYGGSLIVGFLILHFLGSKRWFSVNYIFAHWNLLIPAIAALGLLSLVHVEPPHTGSFVVLFWVGVFSSVRLPDLPESRRLLACVTIAIVTVLVITASFSTALSGMSTANEMIKGKYNLWPYEHRQVADSLKRIGVQPGDKVAVIGYAFENSWARLARVRIVAELPSKVDYWASDSLVKSQVIQTFARTGARVIITIGIPNSASNKGWQKIKNTSYYFYVLPK